MLVGPLDGTRFRALVVTIVIILPMGTLAVGALAAGGGEAATATTTNTTASWLAKRAALTHAVYGKGPGVLPAKAVPDAVKTWPEDTDPRSKGLQGLVWNISNGLFPITSTVFYSPASGDAVKRSKTAFMFHHGHSNCNCPMKQGDPVIVGAKCRPGCNSSMPSNAQAVDQYTWWDLHNARMRNRLILKTRGGP